jgi:hypothetical protein
MTPIAMATNRKHFIFMLFSPFGTAVVSHVPRYDLLDPSPHHYRVRPPDLSNLQNPAVPVKISSVPFKAIV